MHCIKLSSKGFAPVISIVFIAFLLLGVFFAAKNIRNRQNVVTKAQVTPVPSFSDAFSGSPAAPLPWDGANWDTTIQVNAMANDPQSYAPMQSNHGADCAPPPATHTVSTYKDGIYQCKDHIMTATFGDENFGGYSLIYLTPNHMVDFSSGEAVIKFDVSTFRGSTRDWIDVWITPFDEQMAAPLDDFLPILSGEPKRAVHITMDQFGSGDSTGFRTRVIRDFAASDVTTDFSATYEQAFGQAGFPLNEQKARHPFELRISRTHLTFKMLSHQATKPDGTVVTIPEVTWTNTNIADLGWDKGIVQFGHHSYNPRKGDCRNGVCENTWHWDNVSISPATPYALIKANKEYVNTNGAQVDFPKPAPANSKLKFLGVALIDISFDGGKTYQRANHLPQEKNAPEHADSYLVPVPEGTTTITFRGQPESYQQEWLARDISLVSQTVSGVLPSLTPMPTATATPSPTPTKTPTPTPTPTVTPPPTPTKTPTPTPTVPPSPSPTATPCNKIGDLNNDCIVNVGDLSIFLNDFNANNLRSDFNQSQRVDVGDLSIFLSNFGK